MAPQKTRYRATRRTAGDERKEGPCQQGEPANDAAEEPFDRWLKDKLQVLYGPVVNEPIPDEWLRIIGELGKGQKK